ncbi:MAG: carbamoyl-phosphate synthase large subunit [Xylanivirga thermophila]|jgi:carbamoyl-phosphate synthase large subunit|uniref:carbamoyl-phosphate synthase large subunit n=1 Tax=Xylanivirga thermophila TaxID=2496273 RepID=UPI00101C52A0|nr:carbamoyl-phosphate synthase large subunit [Xylanivirga thermophila]
MPINPKIKKVMVIGSGPIIIGQAAEFDYAGTQACKALREEGLSVVLINSNPATIMTDMDMADTVYIEPITLNSISKILYKEHPDGILATFGGQTGLNMAVELSQSGILDELDIELLGTSLWSIKKAEDRKFFKDAMQSISETVPMSTIVNTVDEGIQFAKKLGLPLIVRPAYTLGGTGGGMVHTMNDLIDTLSKGLKSSIIHQVLLEESIAGWKEIEFEVIRDNVGKCLVVCDMENIDPVGIHTGDSIVVAPSQTLTSKQYYMLKKASINIATSLDIKGACNVQFALNPDTSKYAVIEVNPRVSRSSALASKATGYPIARVASKIAIGLNLDEICYPLPQIDYIITKVPRWPFDKFIKANKALGTQMKSTGEVMAIGGSMEESLLKAIDSLDTKLNYHIGMKEVKSWDDTKIIDSLKTPNDERIFAISGALKRGVSIEYIHSLTKIDTFFIQALKNIVDLTINLSKYTIDTIPDYMLKKGKTYGLADSYIAHILGTNEKDVYHFREYYDIFPSYKAINGTPCYYSTYNNTNNSYTTTKGVDKILVIGSGPIRIGQGIEFDYCSVHCVKALKRQGIKAIMVNNNPETVSTDFDTSDTLFFEPLTPECIIDIINKEQLKGVIVQFGGQTSINLARYLSNAGIDILGTNVDNMDKSENRDRFLNLMKDLNIPTPAGGTAYLPEHAIEIAEEIGYPVIIRPSYVLGGRAMEIVYDKKELSSYLKEAVSLSNDHPILIDKYILGMEAEIDGICDGTNVLIAGIIEHIERSGIHSGDSFGIYPPQHMSEKAQNQIIEYTIAIGRELNIKGLFNIQFVIDKNDNVMVIEVNPRASRTVPILSKSTGLPIVSIATDIILGKTLKELGYETGLTPYPKLVTVKAPVFSFSKLSSVDTYLGPEMKSTGEVMGCDKTYGKALYKAILASGMDMPKKGTVLLSIADKDKIDVLQTATMLKSMGFNIVSTPKTYDFLLNSDINTSLITKANVPAAIQNGEIHMVINTPTRGKNPQKFGFTIRREAIEYNIPSITCLDTANALLKALIEKDTSDYNVIPLNQYNKE